MNAIGPHLYVEHGSSLIHLWIRYFWPPDGQGLRWGYTVRLRGRYLLFGGRR